MRYKAVPSGEGNVIKLRNNLVFTILASKIHSIRALPPALGTGQHGVFPPRAAAGCVSLLAGNSLEGGNERGHSLFKIHNSFDNGHFFERLFRGGIP